MKALNFYYNNQYLCKVLLIYFLLSKVRIHVDNHIKSIIKSRYNLSKSLVNNIK